jgi:acyl-CoA dehydrogenase
MTAKLATARFYGDHILPQTLALARIVTNGAPSVLELDAALL